MATSYWYLELQNASAVFTIKAELWANDLILHIFRIHVCDLFYLYFCLYDPEIYTALLNNNGSIVTWLSFTVVNVRLIPP